MQGLMILMTMMLAVMSVASRVRWGKLGARNKIVGGRRVSILQRPFQVSLLLHGSHSCGGSIISAEWIVTAAHCVYRTEPSVVSFRAGSSYYYSGGQTSGADKVICHSKYKKRQDYDIAVVHLSKVLKLSAKIKPIKLPLLGSEWAEGTLATASGWGYLVEGGVLSNTLQAVEVPIVDIEECRKMYAPSKITDRMLCAGVALGGKDSCQADSGGPLTVYHPPILAGVVSWGTGCARPNYPGIYAHVGILRSFISKTTGI